MRLLSVDPGKHKLAFALFIGNDLWDCGIQTLDVFRNAGHECDKLGVEIPRVYPQRQQKGDPNDLIDVAIGAGVAIGCVVHDTSQRIYPSQWKGQRPKAVDNRYTLSLLSDKEKKLVPKDHNVVDAVGIGLWILKRR